jgi:hypothetical protein
MPAMAASFGARKLFELRLLRRLRKPRASRWTEETCRLLARRLLLVGQLLIGEPHVAELDAVASVAGTGCAGFTISGAVSSSLKMRSQAAMAACRMLYLSLRSWMGRQKRCEYWMNMASTPMVTAPWSTPKPPRQMTSAMATEESNLDRRIVERVGEDGVFEGDHVQPVDVFKVLVGALLRG